MAREMCHNLTSHVGWIPILLNMQHNIDRGRKKRQVVDNIRPRSTLDLQPMTSPPLLSRLRNFNNLALSSIGSFFSGPTITNAAAHRFQEEEELSGRNSPVLSFVNELNADADQDSSCFWLKDPQSCLSSSSPKHKESTPVRNGYYSPEAVGYYNTSQRLSSRRLGTHDNLDSSDLDVFPSALTSIKNDLPLVQRASSSHAHILSRRPDVRRFFGDSHCSDTLDENDIWDAYISAERYDPTQNPLELKSTATSERATKTILCATAAVFVPSSPAARALHSLNKSSMASFQMNVTGLDTTSVGTDTPPLTPDSSKTGLLSPASFSTSFEHVDPFYACTLRYPDRMPDKFQVEDDDNDKILYTSPQLLEVKEGKKREQPSLYAQTNYDASLRLPGLIAASAPVSDDPEEWYGLEYTLELSSRERQPLDTQSFSAGEHSKSRESWAAIHRGTIHPFFEDEDYHQWKNWHRLLDKQDERRKYKKGFAFKAHSKDLSCLFVEEIRTRDILYWQKGVYGVVTREVKERLNYITARCPDPYFPPKKHDLGWYLKRSRSVGCIRELKAVEDGTKGPRKG